MKSVLIKVINEFRKTERGEEQIFKKNRWYQGISISNLKEL